MDHITTATKLSFFFLFAFYLFVFFFCSHGSEWKCTDWGYHFLSSKSWEVIRERIPFSTHNSKLSWSSNSCCLEKKKENVTNRICKLLVLLFERKWCSTIKCKLQNSRVKLFVSIPGIRKLVFKLSVMF